MSEKERGKRRVLQGIVTSDKANKTIVVKVIRHFQHSFYKKYIHRSKKYHAHDEANECRIGDTVLIMECHPISKLKRWRVKSIVVRSQM